jgi:hypothetical protein
MGAAPGYKLKKTAEAAEDVKHIGDAVERVLEEVRREFSGLPVYVGDRLAEAVAAHLCRHRASACSDSHSTLRGAGSPR